MITREYWQALRWFLAGWLLVNLLGFTAVGIHFFRHTEITSELIQLKQQLRAIRQKVTQNGTYQPDVAFYLSHRERWQQQGVNLPADPNHWITSWFALQQQWHLPHMQYDIQPAIVCEGEACGQFWPGKPVPGLSMTVTPVKIRWTVSHETDVLYWLQRLHQQYAGTWLVHGCKWEAKALAGAIDAQCELHLFNFPNMFPGSLSAT